MSVKLNISTAAEQLTEGLFGMIFLHVFEILPYLDKQGISPAWSIRSTKYGLPPDFIVIPGLLDLNYNASDKESKIKEINLKALRDDHVVTIGNDWNYSSKLWCKYFRWPERVIERADQFPSLKTALGIHYRGTDKNTDLCQTNPVSQEDFLRLVRDFVVTHPDIDTLFVATDEDSLLAKVVAEHKTLKVFGSGKAVFWKDNTLEDVMPQNRFAKGDHALLDCLLLSRCKYLIKCQSALSGFAKILNPQLEAYRVAASKAFFEGIPYFPDAYIPILTSQDLECQRILAKLQAGDWTQDLVAMKKYGGNFRFKKRKGYIRKERRVPRWSLDGLHMRFDRRFDRMAGRIKAHINRYFGYMRRSPR